MDVSMLRRANAGDMEAQFTLGEMYDRGDGVPQDFAQAAEWHLKAAAQGLAEAQAELGDKYRTGRGVPKDFAEAVAWYRKAAEQGHALAQFNLGLMYRNGEGVPQDAVEAVAWLRKAAEQGWESAQSALGVMYHKGEGVAQDFAQADAWWRKAGARSREQAEKRSREMGVMATVVDCVHLLVRDPVAVRGIKEAYPTDWARRLERFRRGDTPTDDELDMLGDLIRNEGRPYLIFHGEGADYDEDDPSDMDLYSIDVKGLGGIYFVVANEFGFSGFFHSLDDAESYVWKHWDGVTIYGPRQIRRPFGEKKKAKAKKNAKKRVGKGLTKVKKKSTKTATKNVKRKPGRRSRRSKNYGRFDGAEGRQQWQARRSR
jgi:hypothetical protein